MRDRSAQAEELLRELSGRARLVVYVASVPGAGKTRRLLQDARRMQAAGRRVAVGWIDTKGRPDLESVAAQLPRIPTRTVNAGESVYEDFDYDAALHEKFDVVILDELAHSNFDAATHAKRWQDALALKEHGISVYGAFDIAHVETVAPIAEGLLGHPIAEIVPLSFLQSADEVIALDVPIRLLQSRGLAGETKEETLSALRELLLRTVDNLALPAVKAGRTSVATAFVYPATDVEPFLRRTTAVAHALDLALEVVPVSAANRDAVERVARELNGEVLRESLDPEKASDDIRAALVAVPVGKTAAKLAGIPLPYDLFIVGSGQTYIGEHASHSPYSQTAGDRMRVGYGKLTVYLGAAAGTGKTYAMLDRAHQLKAGGIDVVCGFIEPHGRKETEALLDGLEILPAKTTSADGTTYRELDRDAVIARRPKVALIDELAHTNAPGSVAPKRFQDVLAVLREGIDVVTTLNVQHLEALSDTVLRLTGTLVRETLPDSILTLANEVVLIDATPDMLRQRLREGKIYPPERIEAALAHFFRTENLFALRELALREAYRARYRERIASPFERILLSVGSQPTEMPMIPRAGRLAARLGVEFAIAHVVGKDDRVDPAAVEAMQSEARKTNIEWIEDAADDVPKRLLEIARRKPETTVAIGGTHRAPRLFARPTFARRLLEAGARELLVLVRPKIEEEALPED